MITANKPLFMNAYNRRNTVFHLLEFHDDTLQSISGKTTCPKADFTKNL